ncbi:unnamed protein product, partial [Cylicocyclus nassatus]
MFDLLVAYILAVIGLTAGQMNAGTTSSPQCQNDAACTAPSVCIDNICAQGVSCKSNADCDDPRFECNRQFCVPKHQWRPDKLTTCKIDSSCISPATCVDNFCVVNLKCHNDEECGSPHLKCIQSVCILLSEPKPPVSSGQMSLQQSQITTQNGQGASGQIPCQNGNCPPQYVCISGVCVRGAQCTTNNDCIDPRFECMLQNCIPKTQFRTQNGLLMCSNNLDNTCPSLSKCVHNFCMIDLRCRNDYDCGSPQMRCIASVCTVLSISQPGTSSSTGNQGISQGNLGLSTESLGISQGNLGLSTENLGISQGNSGLSVGKGNPSLSTGNLGNPQGNSGLSTESLGISQGNLGLSTENLGISQGNSGLSVGKGNPSLSTGNLGIPQGNSGLSTGNLGNPQGNSGLSTESLGISQGNLGLSTENLGISQGNSGLSVGKGNPSLSTGNLGIPQGNSGLSTGNLGNPQGNSGLSTESLGISQGNLGLSTENLGISQGNSGLSAGKGNPSLSTGNLGISQGNSGLLVGKGNPSLSTGNLGIPQGNSGLSTGNLGISQGKPIPCQQGACPGTFTCVDDVCVQGKVCSTTTDCDPRFDCNQRICVPKPEWRPESILQMCPCSPSAAC